MARRILFEPHAEREREFSLELSPTPNTAETVGGLQPEAGTRGSADGKSPRGTRLDVEGAGVPAKPELSRPRTGPSGEEGSRDLD